MNCHGTPFHLECLETHYEQAHPRPRRAGKERTTVGKDKKVAEEEERILQREADDARSQWVNHTTNLSKIATPLSRKVTGVAIALAAVALVVEPLGPSITADAPMPLLK